MKRLLLLSITLLLCVACSPESRMPETVPDNFRASFSQDGGMNPWGESIRVSQEAGVYSLDHYGVGLEFNFTPFEEQVIALYEALRIGQFDLYEKQEREEMIYDLESRSWSVTAGEVDHRISSDGGSRYEPPSNEVSGTLSAISNFMDRGNLSATSLLSFTILFDESLWSTSRTEIVWSLEGGGLAIGDDRNGDELKVWTTLPAGSTTILIETREEDREINVDLSNGGRYLLTVNNVGQVELIKQ